MNYALYKPTSRSRTLKCSILKDKIPNKHGVATEILIELPGGEQKQVSRFYNQQIAVLVPEEEISQAWKDVLAANPNAKLAVCYRDGLEHMTTLACTKSLAQVRGIIHSDESCAVYMHTGNKITEGKPEVEESYTDYYAGKQPVIFPEDQDPSHY